MTHRPEPEPPIPVFLNPLAGNASAVRKAVLSDGRFRIASDRPGDLSAALQTEVGRGTPRVLVAGGDGTVASGAAVLAHSDTALAIAPGGTLNHFARSLGIPLDPARALDVAAGGAPRDVDVAYVNDHLFLNTSSVGAYLDFVRVRDRWRSRAGYHLASLLAALSTLVRLPSFSVSVQADGRTWRYRTPLVFAGVGERDLRFPSLGERADPGRRGLHMIVTSGRSRARLLATAAVAAARGATIASRAPYLDDFLVDACTVDLPEPVAPVALDGETIRLPSPLRYRMDPAAVRVIVPPGDAAKGR